VIGHEISHSFDNQGAAFDATGALRNWWTDQDLKRFEGAGKLLAQEFDAYEPYPGLHVKGELTLSENIADVAGLAAALDAYHASLKGSPRRSSTDDRGPALLPGLRAKLVGQVSRSRHAQHHRHQWSCA
jgi:predicted metalloendopeptidase